MMMNIRALLVVCSAVVLAACSPGGGSSQTDATDKYVGAWKGCVASGDAAAPYLLATFNLAKASATALTGNIQAQSHANAACTAATSASVTLPYSVTLVDTAVVQGNTVDRVNTVLDGTAIKDIFFVSGNSLYTGGDSTDAAGYPNTLMAPLTKQ